MTEHVLECRWESQRCICEELRACEERVREEWYEVQSETWVRGFDVGVRAAREADNPIPPTTGWAHKY